MTTSCALIIDDEADIRELVAMTISRMGLDCHTAANLEEAQNLLRLYTFDVCLTDMRLPDGNGVDFVSTLQKSHPQMPVAVITAHGNMEAAVEAMKNGAYDFVSKPLDIQQLRKLVASAIANGSRGQRTPSDISANEADNTLFNASNDASRSQSDTATDSRYDQLDTSSLIGTSAPMQEVRRMIGKLASTNAPVWITGESGTGKELIARLIHLNSTRHDQNFVPINCGAIPSELMESELFGHKKGSFTGAINDHEGLFRKAEGGTLFLDEVAELPLHMQVKLLRAIQEKSIRSVGGSNETKVDVRILSASHRDLAREVELGRFRHDLYYRLNVINLRAPSLRERADDIELLTEHILTRLGQLTFNNDANDSAGNKVRLSVAAMQTLQSYPFPGNVRELENILERALAMTDSRVIEQSDLQLQPIGSTTPEQSATEQSVTNPHSNRDVLGKTVQSGTLSESPERERQHIVEALQANRWNRRAAAEQLGLTYRQLRYRIQQLRIDRDS